MRRVVCRLTGRVQGVGFRAWVSEEARRRRLVGYAANLDDGAVEVALQGESDPVEQMCALLGQGPVEGRPGTVDVCVCDEQQVAPDDRDFEQR